MRSGSELPSPESARDGGRDDPASAAPTDDRSVHFADLVRAEFEWVWRLLRRIGLSPADADDATQQVFLVTSRKTAEVRDGSVRPFLYATAIRVAANAQRSLRRRREVASETVDDATAHEPPTDDIVEQHRARALLDELLARLPAELRRVLVLAEIEQLTAHQIAQLEAIPAGTVASRLRRARALFHGYLEEEQKRNPFDRRCS
jgi:RNA polymerase sigma-70 factor, ECF subfamily